MDFKTISKLEYQDYIKNRKNLDKNYSKSIIDKYTEEKPKIEDKEQHHLQVRRNLSKKYYERDKEIIKEKRKTEYQKKKDNRQKEEQEKNKLKSEEEAQNEETQEEKEDEQPIEQQKPKRHPLLDYLIF
jgi:hypothetical protein